MPAIHPRLLLDLSQVSPETWGAAVYQGLIDGRWDEESVENFQRLDKKAQRRAVKGGGQSPPTPSPENPRTRRKSRSREKRLMDRRISPGLRYVRRHSLDPFLDARLSSGARTTLTYLIARCGKAKTFTACTNWIAQDLGVTTRTIQNHYRALEGAGYIFRSSPDEQGRTTIRLCKPVEPPAYRPKKPETSVAPSHADDRKEISPTQAMKARISEGYVEPHSAPEGRELESRKTGAEPPRPARLPSSAFDGEGAPDTLRIAMDDTVARKPEAAGRQPAEPSEFDMRIAAILKSVQAHTRMAPAQEGPEPGLAPRDALHGREGRGDAAWPIPSRNTGPDRGGRPPKDQPRQPGGGAQFMPGKAWGS